MLDSLDNRPRRFRLFAITKTAYASLSEKIMEKVTMNQQFAGERTLLTLKQGEFTAGKGRKYTKENSKTASRRGKVQQNHTDYLKLDSHNQLSSFFLILGIEFDKNGSINFQGEFKNGLYWNGKGNN